MRDRHRSREVENRIQRAARSNYLLSERQEAVLRIYWMQERPYLTSKRINRSLPVATAIAIRMGLPPDTWPRKGHSNSRQSYAPAVMAKPKRLVVTRETVRWALDEGLGNLEARLIARMLADGQAVVAA